MRTQTRAYLIGVILRARDNSRPSCVQHAGLGKARGAENEALHENPRRKLVDGGLAFGDGDMREVIGVQQDI